MSDILIEQFGPVLGKLLAAGHKLTYVPETSGIGGMHADVRTADGRLVATGNGANAEQALAHLRERLEKS